jgi:hypothetical protein
VDDSVFLRALAGGFDVPEQAADLVFVDCADSMALAPSLRVGMLVQLLSSGEAWDAATAATGFALEARPTAGPGGRVLIELDDAVLPFDVFDIAADPMAGLWRMFRAAEDLP